MTIPPTDDALNAAWNGLVAGRDDRAGAGADRLDGLDGLDPADARLLRALHRTAGETQPNSAFRDGLWAALIDRPEMAAHPSLADEMPTSPVGGATMRPAPRMATSGRSWTSPLATIAAALVIALVGYGALSLSGANPRGIELNLNEVPNASAEGQGQEMGLASNPVVGTWVTWANAYTGSNTIVQTMTFRPDGTLITHFSLAKVGTTAGTWSAEANGRVSYTYAPLFDAGSLDEIVTSEDPFIPQLIRVSGDFQLSDDGRTWVDERTSSTSLYVDQSGQPYRITESETKSALQPSSPSNRPPERLEDLIARAPEMTAEQLEALNTSVNNVNSPGGGASTAPTPTVDPTEQTVVQGQATQTAVANQPGSATVGDGVPTPTMPVTVVTPLPSPSPAS